METSTDDFFNRIETSKYLPTLPHIILKLIEVCNRDDSTSKDISQVINKDLSLTAKVLRMVNSVYYGLPQKVSDIGQAISLLGTDAVKNIAISTAVYHAFERAKGDAIFNLKSFWRHSLLCATLAKLIAKKTLYPTPEEAFLSGLLHDIGKLVLWVNFPREYAEIIQSSKNHPDFILAGEMRLGATHCRVGAWLINQWQLQSFMADAVLYHHESVANILDSLPLVKIIYVANILCRKTKVDDQIQYEIAEEVFGFSHPEVEAMRQQAEEEVKQIAESLDIEIAPPLTLEKEDLAKELGKREDILKEVKDMSLLHGTVRNLLEAHDEEAILKIVLQGFQVLFDIKDTFFFLYDSERDMLVGRGIPGQPQHDLLNEVAIPFQNGKSILVRSLHRKEPIDSFSFHKKSSLTIIDEQIIRAMGQGGILCLPMLAHRQAVGVLVLGIDHARFSRLSNQLRLLTLSTSQAALALHAHAIRRSQEKVIQAERLTASLEIARKVAHEVNSPLSIIKNYLKVLELKLPKKDLAQEELKIITEEIDRIALIVRELSDFSEPVIERSETLDINALLTDVTRITKDSDLLDDNIHVHLNLDPFLPTIVSEKNSLKQIFINLLKNAGEAMPDGGNIHITTRHVSHKLLDKAQEDREEVSGSVEITISDDGPGLPETIKARLFEPFVSTKGEGHSGLGLSIVHSILKELGGTVRCSSDGRRGTSFKIILPVEKN
jgi:HD-like signal output (HDOD) protein/signal transduction histidine kinase